MALNDYGWFLDGHPSGTLIGVSATILSQAKYYFEATVTHGYESGFDAGYGVFGICGPGALLNLVGGDLANGSSQTVEAQIMGWFTNTLGSGRGIGYPNRMDTVDADVGANTIYAVAVNTIIRKMWIRNVSAGGAWAGDGLLPDPATNTSGRDYTTNITDGRIYAFVGAAQRNDTNYGAATINLGGTAFTGTVPSGYVAWSAADTLNPSDASPNLVLSGGNLSVSSLGMGSAATYPAQLARSKASAL